MTTHPPLFTGTKLNFAYYSEETGSEDLHNLSKQMYVERAEGLRPVLNLLSTLPCSLSGRRANPVIPTSKEQLL